MILLCLQPYGVLKTGTSKHTEQGLVHTLGTDGRVDINQCNRNISTYPYIAMEKTRCYGQLLLNNYLKVWIT